MAVKGYVLDVMVIVVLVAGVMDVLIVQADVLAALDAEEAVHLAVHRDVSIAVILLAVVLVIVRVLHSVMEHQQKVKWIYQSIITILWYLPLNRLQKHLNNRLYLLKNPINTILEERK